MSKLEIVQFNANKVLQNFTVVNCKTLEQAKTLLRWANSIGLKWSSGESYLKKHNWSTYCKDTCYRLKYGTFSPTSGYTALSKMDAYTVLDFEEALANGIVNNQDGTMTKDGILYCI